MRIVHVTDLIAGELSESAGEEYSLAADKMLNTIHIGVGVSDFAVGQDFMQCFNPTQRILVVQVQNGKTIFVTVQVCPVDMDI